MWHVPLEKEYFSKRLTSKFRYKMYLNFDVKRFEKYSFSYKNVTYSNAALSVMPFYQFWAILGRETCLQKAVFLM